MSYGADMTRENNPLECGLERYCKLDGPEFIGKAALQRVQAEGPARLVRGIRFEGEPAPACRVPWALSAAGAFAGKVTSAAWSPRFETNIGLAMMERGYWEPGTEVAVALPDGTAQGGLVCELPFADTED